MKYWRTLHLIIIVLVFGITSCRAQSPVIQVTPSNETTLDHWQKFSSPDAAFQIYFPAQPFEQRYSIDSPAGKLDVHSYKFVGSASYFVSYTDYPSPIDGTADVKANLDRAREGGLRAVNGHLVSESLILLQGHPGRVIVVDSPNGGPQGSMITNKVYLVGRRLYSMQVAIPKDTHQSLDAAAQKFLDSFKLVDASNR
jgi:hypothetical protein